MLSVDCRPRQKLSMQTGGSSVFRKLPILIQSFLPLRVLQQDTELYTAMTYAKWMLHIADFSGKWSGLLATWIGHCHGMKCFIFGMNAFGYSLCRQHPNHGRTFAYDIIGMWHNISQHYLGIVGPKKYWLGNLQGINALAGQKTLGILCSQIFVG